ncbi:glycosyltransferase family 2 protein [Geodermatophilus amargosae]|nr:glycosyltransferase family 2 protein [Geodermatophilus amargosae]
MIVRNGAATLADCLESVAAVADELIVVDTGSCDETVSIAERLGAHVIAAPWTNDFAAARNRYLRVARRSWILSLDADERLLDPDVDRIRAIVDAHPRTAFGVTVRNFFDHDLEWPRFLAPSEFGGRASARQSWHVSRTIRLFPRLSGLTYRYPVHESLIPAARQVGVRLRLSDLVVHHREGSAAGTAHTAPKTAQYSLLGRAKVDRHPRCSRGHLEMARVHLDGGAWALAEDELRECLRLSPMTGLAGYYLGEVLLQTGRLHDLKRLLARSPMSGIDRCHLEGRRLLVTCRHERAAALLRRVVAEKPGYRPARRLLDTALDRSVINRPGCPTGR